MRGAAVLSESCVRILKPCREVRSMTSRPLTNVPASVHQRLLNLAQETNRPFNELLQYFAIQRFLFRFSRSAYPEQFVLKGAQMLQAWDAPLARPTMDIDMLGRVSNTVENLEQIVRACATVEVDADGVEFDPQSVRGEVIVKGKAYEGVRTRLRGTLGKIKLKRAARFRFRRRRCARADLDRFAGPTWHGCTAATRLHPGECHCGEVSSARRARYP